jgi:pimeloyl-ACP methyl ester carboxylesterase
LYSLRYLAHSIDEFMECQGIARAHIVGHSLGGAIALQFAHDYPERVDRMVLLAPAAYIFNWLKPIRYAARVPILPRRFGEWLLSNPNVHRTAYRNALGDPRKMDTKMLDARIRATRVKGTLDALLAMCSSREACELPEGLPELRAPALIVWGDRDYALPPSHGRRLVRDLPNAELVILEGAGHLANSEFPDRVNRMVLDFFRGKDNGA